MRKYRLIILFHVACIFIVLNNCYSQKVIHIDNVKGKISIREVETAETAKNRAIIEAKLNALRLAGLFDFIYIPRSPFGSEENAEVSDFFNYIMFRGLHGSIIGCNLLGFEMDIDSKSHNIIVEATIDTEIILFDSEPDPKLNAKLDNLGSILNINDELSFSVICDQDCYLTLFLASNNQAVLLNPVSNESIINLEAGKQKTLSYGTLRSKLLEYWSVGGDYLLILVFMKNPNKFLDYNTTCNSKLPNHYINPDDILLWVYSQSPDTRELQIHSIRMKPQK